MKLLIKKNTFENNEKPTYSATFKARGINGETLAYSYMPVSFKLDNKPDEKMESFLIETNDFFLAGYVSGKTQDGRNIGKTKIVVLSYQIVEDYTSVDKKVENAVSDISQDQSDELPF